MEIKTSDLVFILAHDDFLTGTVTRQGDGLLFETKTVKRFFNYNGKLIWSENQGVRKYAADEKVQKV